MNDNTYLKDLVRLVFAKADLTYLVDKGLRYTQISQLIEKSVTMGYLKPQDAEFLVTTKGLELIHDSNKNNRNSKKGWIRRLDSAKKASVTDEIYLPDKNAVGKLPLVTSTGGANHGESESLS